MFSAWLFFSACCPALCLSGPCSGLSDSNLALSYPVSQISQSTGTLRRPVFQWPCQFLHYYNNKNNLAVYLSVGPVTGDLISTISLITRPLQGDLCPLTIARHSRYSTVQTAVTFWLTLKSCLFLFLASSG